MIGFFVKYFKIGFHEQKKDKCLKCIQYENNFDPEKEKEEHELEKEESYVRLKVHKDDP